jgi:hypothetical protein
VKFTNELVGRSALDGLGPDIKLKAPLPVAEVLGTIPLVATLEVWTWMTSVNHCPTLTTLGGWLK